MPDILANGDYGRDDGVQCDTCGGKTFLVYDDGYGLRSYECEKPGCDERTNVQFDCDDDVELEAEGWEQRMFDDFIP